MTIGHFVGLRSIFGVSENSAPIFADISSFVADSGVKLVFCFVLSFLLVTCANGNLLSLQTVVDELPIAFLLQFLR